MVIDLHVFYFSDAQRGGRRNAYTASEHTNYYFDVNSDGFEEALDRLMLLFLLAAIVIITILKVKFCVDVWFLVQICSVLY